LSGQQNIAIIETIHTPHTWNEGFPPGTVG